MASGDGIRWGEISLPTYDQTDFSPQVEKGFSGVALWAPQQVSLRATGGRFPVAGTVQLPEADLAAVGVDDRHPVRAAVIGVITAGVNQPHVGNAVTQAPLFPAPPGPTVVEHFAVDLFEVVGLPRAPGKFFVFASVGPHVARTLTVEVVP